ncbi:MAG: hypothetical protein QW557_04490, partial [Candidatus Nitrosocaldus sp.]
HTLGILHAYLTIDEETNNGFVVRRLMPCYYTTHMGINCKTASELRVRRRVTIYNNHDYQTLIWSNA